VAGLERGDEDGACVEKPVAVAREELCELDARVGERQKQS
jgi:hypothetical protein